MKETQHGMIEIYFAQSVLKKRRYTIIGQVPGQLQSLLKKQFKV